MILRTFLVLLSLSFHVHALELTQSQFCLQYDNGSGSSGVRTELLKRAIKVEGDINPHLLSVLEAMFRDYLIFGPLKIVQVTSSGPRKAWVEGSGKERVLKLSSNAADLLLGVEINKVVEKVCGKKLTQPMSFQVSWTNTVYEQVLRELIPPENLKRKFINKTNWQLTSVASDPDVLVEQEFRNEELPTLAKQLMDLPIEVIERMAIKRIVRARVGRSLPNNAAALYMIQQQKIVLSDAALMDGAAIYGEDTLLHEMGHAWWYTDPGRLQERFIEISWIQDGKGYIRKGDSSEGFVSNYAMTKPEDDFAESFAAYVHAPEWLMTKAPQKYEFIRKHIFKDVTYFSTVAKNARVFIDSDKPDDRPPWIDGPLENCYSHKKSEHIFEVEMEVTVKCVRDNLSGPAKSSIHFNHEKGLKSYLIVDLVPSDAPDEKGTWTLTGTARKAYKELNAGRYKSSYFSLKDRAGNSVNYDLSKVSGVTFKGEMGEGEKSFSDIDWSKVKFESIAAVAGFPGYKFTLPISHEASLSSLHLNWYHEVNQERAVHVLSPRHPLDLTSKAGDAQITGEIFFHKEHDAGKMSFNGFSFNLKGTPQTAPSDHQFTRPSTHDISVQMPGPGIKRADVDVNRMKLTAVNKKNSKGGEWSINLKIPITRIKETEFDIDIVARAPSGKSISFYATESSLARRGGRLYTEVGLEWLEVPLELLPHPEKGVYLFESFKVETKVKYDRSFPNNLDQTDFIRRIKLLERGIRKEFTILPDESLQLR